MKTLALAAIVMLFTANSFAQTIDEGKKFLYYERYKSAKDVFQKLTTSSPNDETAAYYLGQAMLGLQDVAGAKAWYQQKLSAAPNSPLLLAGMGHIGLIEGNSADAKSRFETAINMSSGKRIDVLNAVGFANSSLDVKNGDPSYAIDKLNQATTLKGFKDPEVFVNLGDAYRKNNDGSNAERSYQSALGLNPNYVRAIYRSGRLYQSQGDIQKGLFLDKYEQVMAKDPNFAPVYGTLFNYYYNSEVSKSAVYMEKWLSNSDDDGNACYTRASLKFAQGLYAETVAKCEECLSAANAPVNLYSLKAVAQLRLNDSMGAKTNYEKYFQAQSPTKITATDYAGYANTLLKFPGSEDLAASYFTKAIAADSIVSNKVIYTKSIATAYRNAKNYAASASWFNALLGIKKNYTNVDIYNAGIDYYRANKFDSSVIAFNKYTAKYPNDINGYQFVAQSTARIDSNMATGQAAAAYTKVIEVGEKVADLSKTKEALQEAYTYMVQYSFNFKKDQAAAIAFADKAVAMDPTNAENLKTKEFVTKNNPNAKAPSKPSAPKPAVTTKPASTTKPVVTPPKTGTPKTTAAPKPPVKRN